MNNFHKSFTSEEIEQAKNINILEYLSSKGYSFKKVGTNYLLNPHSSFIIFPNTNSWFYYKENKGGDLINFLQYYENKTFNEAMLELSGDTITEKRKFTKYVPIVEEKGKIILPNSNKDNKQAYAYLTKTRGIDSDIVNELFKSGHIYQNDKGSVVFVSRDKENKVKFACVRSTSKNSNFRQDIKNSVKEYGFKTVGTSNRLFVFEAPIDLLSHATISKMQGKDWKKDNRISLGGVSDKALNKFLEENKNIKEIVFFLDNDIAGIENSKKMAKKYGNDYNVKIFTSSKGKDLNDMLLNYKKEKEINNNLNLKDFIEQLETPFITPKLKDSNNILNELEKYIDNSEKEVLKTFDYFSNNQILAETLDNKSILFINNEKGQNIGGFKFDLYNKDFKLKLLKGSEQSYLFYKNQDKLSSESICLVDDPLLYVNLEYIFDLILVEDLKDIEIIKSINKDILKDYKEIGIISKDNETFNFYKDENLISDLKKYFEVEKIWSDNLKCTYNTIIEVYNKKEQNLKNSIKNNNEKYSIKDKIKQKQTIVNQNKQEKLINNNVINNSIKR